MDARQLSERAGFGAHFGAVPMDDPIGRQVLRYAAVRGVHALSVAQAWKGLRAAGLAFPGLAFADWVEITAIGGPLTPILTNCPDVGTLLQDLADLHRLVGRDRLTATDSSGSVAVSLRAPDGGAADQDTVDACFATLCNIVSHLTDCSAGPSRIMLRRRSSSGGDAHRAAFGGDVLWGQSEDKCVFDRSVLSTPVRHADPVIRSMLSPYAQRRVAHSDTPWTSRVAELFAEDSPSLAEAARSLAVSSRTLQTRLEDEGTSFAALTDSIRQERALALMSQPDLPITAIAARLGFATPSAFTKAFRRWTGVAPSRYRREA